MKKILLLLVILITSCTKESNNKESNNSEENELVPEYSNTEIIEYFQSIALGFEYGDASEITRRWEEDINLYLGGNITNENLIEINRIIDEINELITIDISLNIVNDSINSNHYLYIGSSQEYNKIFPDNIVNQIGSFWTYFDSNNLFFYCRAFVDSNVSSIQQKHLIREELTQSLGLAKDSYTYPESIFQQRSTLTTEYAKIDRDLIRLLYHPQMSAGLDAAEVENVIRKILD